MEFIGLFGSLLLAGAFWATVFSGAAKAEGPTWLWASVGAHVIACALLRRQWIWMRAHPGVFLWPFKRPAQSVGLLADSSIDPAWIYSIAIFLPLIGYNLSGAHSEKPSPVIEVPKQSVILVESGGSPTIRESFTPVEDDPDTTNDESNDQPLGKYGTETLSVFNYDSGHFYTLDGDLNDGALERLYFPKGGWVDFYSCDLDGELQGECTDENGRLWSIDGEG